jgi:hypothetical protein
MINHVGLRRKPEGSSSPVASRSRFSRRYREGDRIAAVATIGRNRVSFAAEVLFRRDDQAGLKAALRA